MREEDRTRCIALQARQRRKDKAENRARGRPAQGRSAIGIRPGRESSN